MIDTKIKDYFDDYKTRLIELLESVNVKDLELVISTMISTFKNNKTVYVCGNGGSAATASHIQADFSFFVRYFTKFRPKVRALTDNVAMITAVGNDTTFNDIFVEQLKGHFEKGDAIICISASGNSENVIRAAQYANDHGGTSIGFIGFSKVDPFTRIVSPSFCIDTPHDCIALMVDCKSSPSFKFVIQLTPLAMEASIIDRCEIDLSPGNEIVELIIIILLFPLQY